MFLPLRSRAGFVGTVAIHGSSVARLGRFCAALALLLVATACPASAVGNDGPDGAGRGDSTFPYGMLASFASCPNDALRVGHPSAELPDCRAYEQATPVNKNGGDAWGQLFRVQAGVAGDGITFQTRGGIPGGEGAQSDPLYLSRRGLGSWSTRGLLPPPSYGENALVQGWTPDLAQFMLIATQIGDEGAPTGNALLVRSAADNAIRQITPYIPDAEYAFAGASSDGSKLFFEIGGPSLSGAAAPGKDNLYVYEPASEELSLVGVLPDGTAPPDGSFAGPFDWNGAVDGAANERLLAGGALGPPGGALPGGDGYLTQELHAISNDGSMAFFTAGLTGRLYMREGIGGEAPATVWISASQRTSPDPAGIRPAIFMGATPSGSTVFFTSCEKLTDDSTAQSTSATDCQLAGQGQDLYAYDTKSLELHDLTVDAGDPLGADVQGLIGASEDGSYVYFVANGDLDGPAGPAHAGDCEHKDSGGVSYSGVCNLYAWHAGVASFVAQLEPVGSAAWSDATDWLAGGVEYPPTGHVSADGQAVVFRSHLPLSGYDNELPGGECTGHNACPELFRYHVGDVGPSCLTCTPTGAPPVFGGPTLQSIDPGFVVAAHPIGSRFVSASGEQVFFETPEKLVEADVNGDASCPLLPRPTHPTFNCQDVYEWEAADAGSCSEASSAFSTLNDGCLYLLSSGTGTDPSYFGDASASGAHAYIFTSDQLVPSDEDQLYDIYDVAVEGGLAAQNKPPPPPPCEGGACLLAAAAAPSDPTVGSASFQGPGDPAPERCSQGKVAKGGRCTKPRHKHHRRHRHAAKKRSSGRGGGR